MSVKLSQSQLEFKEGVRTFFEGEITPEYIKKLAFKGALGDPALKTKLEQMGFFGSFAPESRGGVGLGALELSILANEAGRVLLPGNLIYDLLAGPFLLSRMLSAESIAQLEQSTSKERISAVFDGTEKVGIALSSGRNLKFTSDLKVSGEISFSTLGEGTGFLLIGGAAKLWLVDLKERNLKVESVSLLDGLRGSAKVFLDNITAIELKLKSSTLESLGLEEILYLAAASEIAGISERAVTLTVNHVKTRKQFDVPIGGFQAVQHKLSEMYLYSQAQNSLTIFAAWALDNSPEQAALALNSAMNFASEWGPWIVENAIQLHGGIGFTWEYELHLYLRRVRTLTALLSREDRAERILQAAGMS